MLSTRVFKAREADTVDLSGSSEVSANDVATTMESVTAKVDKVAAPKADTKTTVTAEARAASGSGSNEIKAQPYPVEVDRKSVV